MWRYFYNKGTYRWIDIVQQLVDNYNHSEHRSIKARPVDVTKDNEQLIRSRLYPEEEEEEEDGGKRNAIGDKLSVNDYVRISKYKHTFEKSYVPNWTEEIFQIVKVVEHKAAAAAEPVYQLVDLQNKPIIGSFYRFELQRIVYVPYDSNKVYKIEKVLKKRVKSGQPEVYVKWFGWPKQFNQWVPQRDIVSV